MAKRLSIFGLWILSVLAPGAARIRAEPLGPRHVLVVANANVKDSGEVAAHYARARGIPADHVVAIDAPDATDISREVFDERIRRPIERAIVDRKLKEEIRALAMIYGVPMKVGAPDVVSHSEKLWEDEQNRMREEIAGLRRGEAAVDSELALLFRERDAKDFFGFTQNPAFGREELSDLREVGITIVGRIDGPTPEIARRLVDDAIAAERGGLAGKGYFDGRWESFGKGPVGYAAGDWFVRCAYIHARNAGFESLLDESGDLFAKDGCPDCALYYGWYSLHNFHDHFGKLARGAIAIHIASAEGGIKFGGGRGPDSPNEGGPWCLGLLRAGAAVTAGPLSEPYLSAFPQGFVFFREIFCGRTVCEAYWLSIPWVSWQMHFIGDPLYAPFRAKPREGFVFLRGVLVPDAKEPDPLPVLAADATGRDLPIAIVLDRPHGAFPEPFRFDLIRKTGGIKLALGKPSFKVSEDRRKLEASGITLSLDPRRAPEMTFEAAELAFTAGEESTKTIEILIGIKPGGPARSAGHGN